MKCLFPDLIVASSAPARSRRRPAMTAVSDRCPFEADTNAHDAWRFGAYDATQRYVAYVPFAGRERTIAYLHGFHDTRAGAEVPALPAAALEAAWSFGTAVAAMGARPEAALAALTAAVEHAFEQAFEVLPDG